MRPYRVISFYPGGGPFLCYAADFFTARVNASGLWLDSSLFIPFLFLSLLLNSDLYLD